MITLYRTPSCPRCLQVQDVLEEMALAHEVVVLRRHRDLPADLPAGTRLPALLDEGQVYQGSEAIQAHLEELERFRELWYKYQSDACYCDEQGSVE